MVRQCLGRFARGDGKGHQGRRDVQPLERAAHRILSADGGDTQFFLGAERPQQRRKRFSPPRGIAIRPLEVFLKRQINVLKRSAAGNQLRDGFHHGKIGAVVRTLFGKVRVIPPGHERAVVRMLAFHRELLHHGLCRRCLILAAERHQYRSGTDGRVEPFGKPSFGTNVKIRSHFQKFRRKFRTDGLCILLRTPDVHRNMFFRPVGT